MNIDQDSPALRDEWRQTCRNLPPVVSCRNRDWNDLARFCALLIVALTFFVIGLLVARGRYEKMHPVPAPQPQPIRLQFRGEGPELREVPVPVARVWIA